MFVNPRDLQQPGQPGRNRGVRKNPSRYGEYAFPTEPMPTEDAPGIKIESVEAPGTFITAPDWVLDGAYEDPDCDYDDETA